MHSYFFARIAPPTPPSPAVKIYTSFVMMFRLYCKYNNIVVHGGA